jgi:peroxiredoxin
VKKTHQGGSSSKTRGASRSKWSWLPFGLIGLGALLLIALLVVAISKGGEQTVIPPQIGASLSNFTLTDLQGQKVQLSDYKGQVVLVNTWATWCPPCRAEMPDLNSYYQTHKNEGFVVLAINAGDPQSSAAEFAQNNHLAFPVLLDSNLQVLDGFGIHSFPTSIVVGRDGRVKTIHVGMYSPEALAADITPLLSQ